MSLDTIRESLKPSLIGSSDWIEAVSNMLKAGYVFGAMPDEFDSSRIAPLAPGQLPYTDLNYAQACVMYWEKHLDDIIDNLGDPYLVIHGMRHVQAGIDTLDYKAWRESLGPARIVAAANASEQRQVRIVEDMANAAEQFLGALELASMPGGHVLNDFGTSECMDATSVADFWQGMARFAVAAQNSEALIEYPDMGTEILDAITRLPDTVETVVDYGAGKAGEAAAWAGGVAGSALGEFLKGLGLVPIAIGVGAIYVGVKVI